MSETDRTDQSPLDAAHTEAADAGLELTELRSTPLPATAVDAQGIERIVSYPNNFTPAPVDPDPEAIARAEALEKVLDAHADERTTKLAEVSEPAVAEPTPQATTSPATPSTAASAGSGSPLSSSASSTSGTSTSSSATPETAGGSGTSV